MVRLSLCCIVGVALLYSIIAVSAQEDASPMMDGSMLEVGSTSTISMQAARPLQEVAQLLVETNKNLNRLRGASTPFSVVSNHIRVRRQTNINLPAAAAPAPAQAAPSKTVDATLVAKMVQPRIHDAEKFGTKHPFTPGQKYVTAQIVGEDGKPYVARKQYGVEDDAPVFRSPFAKYIHPPKVGSSADVANTDPNTKLTPIELKTVNSIQFRLKKILDKLGANIVWDHTNVKNRRLIAEFDALKAESRTLMEEYELRTGVKTIAWQLQDTDNKGLTTPNGQVTDIHFAESPELAGRVLQRAGSHVPPPALTKKQLQALQAEHGVNVVPPKPKEQRVDVQWKKQADGTVKAKVNLNVVDSKQAPPNLPPKATARQFVPGKVYPSGRIGSPSAAVNIDVVAPKGEDLVRNKGQAAPAKSEDASFSEVAVDSAPAINL